jgi:hypothetical protein
MSKITEKTESLSEEYVNDLSLDTFPRRQGERRKLSRRESCKPQLISIEKITKLRKLDDDTTLVMRVCERREKDRRKSKPCILPADDIAQMRKK